MVHQQSSLTLKNKTSLWQTWPKVGRAKLGLPSRRPENAVFRGMPVLNKNFYEVKVQGVYSNCSFCTRSTSQKPRLPKRTRTRPRPTPSPWRTRPRPRTSYRSGLRKGSELLTTGAVLDALLLVQLHICEKFANSAVFCKRSAATPPPAARLCRGAARLD